MHLSSKDIKNTDRVKRLNIINSITGIKPANLIGTKSEKGISNLAIISSVVHLGSDPALIGFVMRPGKEVRRDTYNNITATGHYTINHIPTKMVKQAHYTSAKFEEEVSEFEACNFTEEYIEGFNVPFVKESPVKLGMKLVEKLPIELNGTVLMIGQIEHLVIPDEAVSDKGYINLAMLNIAGISGLNSYYALTKLDDFPYARVHEVPDFSP